MESCHVFLTEYLYDLYFLNNSELYVVVPEVSGYLKDPVSVKIPE